MTPIPFPEFLEKTPCVLGEGAVIERLRRDGDFDLDPDIVNSAFIYDGKTRAAISTIYRQYLEIGRRYDLPLLLSTPTWRASRERIVSAGYEDKDINRAGSRHRLWAVGGKWRYERSEWFEIKNA